MVWSRLTGAVPFMGADLWTAYELSWLNPRGKPQVALAHILVPCESTHIVESKSFKLYLNSFNNTVFEDADAVRDDVLFASIYAALLKHKVLFFRDQPLTAEQLKHKERQKLIQDLLTAGKKEEAEAIRDTLLALGGTLEERLQRAGGSLDRLVRALMDGDEEALGAQLQAFVTDVLSYHDLGGAEEQV